MTPAALVANPAIVHRIIGTRLNTHEFIEPGSHRDIAVASAMRTKRFCVGQIPGPGLKSEFRIGQRTYRTNIDDISGEAGVVRFVVKCTNLVMETAV